MVTFVKIYRNNKYVNIPLSDWISEQFKYLPIETENIFSVISEIFEIRKEEDYERIHTQLWIDFNYRVVIEKYDELKKLNLPFNDDIIKFIAFLYGTNYFKLIGSPSLDIWLNSKDFNNPFKSLVTDGYSLIDAINYDFGQNAVKSRLISALKVLGPQGG